MQDEDLTVPRRIEFCTGSFMAVRTDVFKEIGGFDPGYFMYVVVADLAQVGADRDVRVVVGQGDIIGGGHALEITVLVKRIGKAEISQIGVLGVRGLSAGLLGGVSRLGGRFSGLGRGGVSGIAAGRKHSSHADSHAKGCHTAEILQFHGILLSFSKLHTFLLYTIFRKSKMKLL